jgi:hypothetical protein
VTSSRYAPVSTMAKRDKQSVDYSKGKPNAHCEICTHFEKPQSCELVEGKIDPAMWCKLFHLKPGRTQDARERYGR